jgi:hypothetical protein
MDARDTRGHDGWYAAFRFLPHPKLGSPHFVMAVLVTPSSPTRRLQHTAMDARD